MSSFLGFLFPLPLLAYGYTKSYNEQKIYFEGCNMSIIVIIGFVISIQKLNIHIHNLNDKMEILELTALGFLWAAPVALYGFYRKSSQDRRNYFEGCLATGLSSTMLFLFLMLISK